MRGSYKDTVFNIKGYSTSLTSLNFSKNSSTATVEELLERGGYSRPLNIKIESELLRLPKNKFVMRAIILIWIVKLHTTNILS